MSETQPVDELTFTECMEQLQEGYVASIAATAGFLLNPCEHDTYGFDSMIVKKKGPDEEETSIYVQLKCTTVVKPDLNKPTFSYVLKKNEYYRRLAVRRKRVKAILLVMVTTGDQKEWAAGDHNHLKTQHACYWGSTKFVGVASLAPQMSEVDPGVKAPVALSDHLVVEASRSPVKSHGHGRCYDPAAGP